MVDDTLVFHDLRRVQKGVPAPEEASLRQQQIPELIEPAVAHLNLAIRRMLDVPRLGFSEHLHYLAQRLFGTTLRPDVGL